MATGKEPSPLGESRLLDCAATSRITSNGRKPPPVPQTKLCPHDGRFAPDAAPGSQSLMLCEEKRRRRATKAALMNCSMHLGGASSASSGAATDRRRRRTDLQWRPHLSPPKAELERRRTDGNRAQPQFRFCCCPIRRNIHNSPKSSARPRRRRHDVGVEAKAEVAGGTRRLLRACAGVASASCAGVGLNAGPGVSACIGYNCAPGMRDRVGPGVGRGSRVGCVGAGVRAVAIGTCTRTGVGARARRSIGGDLPEPGGGSMPFVCLSERLPRTPATRAQHRSLCWIPVASNSQPGSSCAIQVCPHIQLRGHG